MRKLMWRALLALCLAGAAELHAQPIAIVNPGFEADFAPDGGFPVLDPVGWSRYEIRPASSIRAPMRWGCSIPRGPHFLRERFRKDAMSRWSIWSSGRVALPWVTRWVWSRP